MRQEEAYKELLTKTYPKYQERYKSQPAERDKRLAGIIEDVLVGWDAQNISLLDVGCHTANLLRHLISRFSSLTFSGCDIWPEVIEKLKEDQSLSKINFFVGDVLNLSACSSSHDIIVCNAVLWNFTNNDYLAAARELFETLNDGGVLICLDMVTEFDQTLDVREYCEERDYELRMAVRAKRWIHSTLSKIGYQGLRFFPFQIGIDLEPEGELNYGGLNSRTVKKYDGQRMSFRGDFYQPWCHYLAFKPI